MKRIYKVSLVAAAVFSCGYVAHHQLIDGLQGWIIGCFNVFGTAEITEFSPDYTVEKFRQITALDCKESVRDKIGEPLLVSVTTGSCNTVFYEASKQMVHEDPIFSESWEYSMPRFTDHSGVLYRLRRVVFNSYGNVIRTETGTQVWKKVLTPATERVKENTMDEFGALFSRDDPSSNLSAPELASRKNQLMDDLLARDEIPAGYAEAMEALYRDRSNDDILRGFAVQHLLLHAETLFRRGSYDPASPESGRVRSTLFEAARESGTSIGGTALLALERLSHMNPDVDRNDLARLSVRYASDSSCHLQTRIAAVQVCGLLRLSEARPILEKLSADPASNTALRLAARHSLSLLD